MQLFSRVNVFLAFHPLDPTMSCSLALWFWQWFGGQDQISFAHLMLSTLVLYDKDCFFSIDRPLALCFTLALCLDLGLIDH